MPCLELLVNSIACPGDCDSTFCLWGRELDPKFYKVSNSPGFANAPHLGENFDRRIMHPKDADRLASSVDPNHTAPQGAVWINAAQSCLSKHFGSLW